MKVFKTRNSIMQAQFVSVPCAVYNNYSFKATVFINIAETYKIIGKLRLLEDKALSNCCFIDTSVILPKCRWEEFDLIAVDTWKTTIDEGDINFVIERIKEAESIEVILVCSITVVAMLKKEKKLCEKLVADILELFVVCQGCIVNCGSIPESKFNYIVITNITGKECDAFKVNRKTRIVVKEVFSEKRISVRQTIPRNVRLDCLFTSTEMREKPLTLLKIGRIVADVLSSPSAMGFKPDKNLLIVGPSGCGKSSMIHSIAKVCQKVVLTVSCSDTNLVSFSSKFSKVIEEAKLHVQADEPCLILIKDLHSICKKRSTVLTDKLKWLLKDLTLKLAEIPTIMDIAVVATTHSPEEIDSSLKKNGCFSQEVEVPMLNEEDRKYIFHRLTSMFGVMCSKASAKAVAQWTPGYVLSDLLSIVRDSASLLQKRKPDSEGEELNCFKKAVSCFLPSTLRGAKGLVTTHKSTFADIGGLEKVKTTLKMSVHFQMAHPEAFERLGIPPTKGILLYGPPGCAKTTLVKALANESRATFLAISAADLYSPYVGEAEKSLSKLFMQARIGAPSIVFIDEIDALVGSKDGNRDRGVQERILATLLMEMDGVGVNIKTSDSLTKIAEGENGANVSMDKVSCESNLRVIFVGATNRPELIDDALKRPGRFDKLIFIPPPDFNERLTILQKITTCVALAKDVNLALIAERTKHFSGADLKNVCTESGLLALTKRGMEAQQILQEDFENVLTTFRPSLLENAFT